jgi:hypothetical protein
MTPALGDRRLAQVHAAPQLCHAQARVGLQFGQDACVVGVDRKVQGVVHPNPLNQRNSG